ncbi:MAG: hypothetical protein AAGH15_15405 [Myxococcota bacterium]
MSSRPGPTPSDTRHVFLRRATESLVLLRLGPNFDEDGLVELEARLAELRAHATVPIVFVSDLRWLPILKPTVSDGLVSILRRDNAAVERAAIFVGSGTLTLQMTRIVREANHPGRAVFSDGASSLDFLRRSLDESEMRIAESFLAQEYP